jgi:hypothetical protein
VSLLFLHFVAGTVGALVVFLVIARLSGERRFSAPFGVVFVGLACAVLAHFLSPWATPAIVALYALVAIGEWRHERRRRRNAD